MHRSLDREGSNRNPHPSVFRVLVVSPWGSSGAYSGPVVLQSRLFAALNRNHGTEVDLLFRQRDSGASSETWARSAIALIGGEELTPWKSLVWSLRASVFMLRRSREYDVVHLQGMYFLNLLPSLFVSRRTRLVALPVLEGGDLSVSGSGPRVWAKHVLLRAVLRRCDYVFALSQGIRDEARQLHYDDASIIDIANPVTQGFFRTRRFRENRRFRMLFSGKLGVVKQPHRVLTALRALLDLGIDAEAVFMGPFASPSYEREFRKMLSDLSLGNVVSIRGYVQDPMHVLADEEFDVFVLPSRAEGMPGALAEAMSSGLPALVTDVGAMGSVIQSSGAGVVIGDDETLTQALVEMAMVSELWEQASRNANQYSEAWFSDAAVAETYNGHVRD